MKNPLGKTVGKIRLSFFRSGFGTVNGKISSLFHITVNVDLILSGTRTYSASRQLSNSNYVTVIEELYNEVFENSDLQKRIIATTY